MDPIQFVSIFTKLAYVREAISIFGIIGNILTFLVLSRNTFANNSISVYCRALTITDSYVIVGLVYDLAYFQFNKQLEVTSNAACKIFYFPPTVISPMSDWFLTSFSLDTMFQVLHIKKLSFLNQRRYQYVIVAFIVMFHLGMYSAVSLTTDLITVTAGNVSSIVCDLNYGPVSKKIFSVYVVLSNILPFALMLLSTVIIVRCLQKSRTRLGHSVSTKNVRKAKEFRFAFSSILLSVVFTILKLPLTVYYYSHFEDFYLNLIIFTACQIFMTCNYTFRIVFHLIGNSLFRREFLTMIGLNRKTRPSSVSENSNKAIVSTRN